MNSLSNIALNKIKDEGIAYYIRNDWNRMARDILNIKLDEKQQELLYAIQTNPRVTARSGHAWGKDFVAAAASLCFLYSYPKSKVVATAPTGRQAIDIEMAEITEMWQNSTIPLGGRLLTDHIKFKDNPKHYLTAFKAADKSVEAWNGFHSSHIMVVATEASGMEGLTFDAMEGILTGEVTRQLLVGNPRRTIGYFYDSHRSPRFKQFVLSCLDVPDVKEKRTITPGRTDYAWVKDKVDHWCQEIPHEEANPENFDFEFDRKWYRPNDDFLVKVMGEFPRTSTDQLIPLFWVEQSFRRWKEGKNEGKGQLRLGVDIAGMGRDKSVYCHRYTDVVPKFDSYANPGRSETIHMENAGRGVQIVRGKRDYIIFTDSIGEGGGVHARFKELGKNSVSAKFSEAAKNHMGKKLTDMHGTKTFKNMRAYCWWAVRDALDPSLDMKLALPPNEELKEDLTTPTYKVLSSGDILLEPKEDIASRLKRSPDFGDALALSFFPKEPLKDIVMVV